MPDTSHISNKACIVDVGTGYTKLGYSNPSKKPQSIIPTAIATPDRKKQAAAKTGLSSLDDLYFYIGYEAENRPGYSCRYPMRNAIIQDWNLYEQFMEKIMYQELRCNPDEHSFILTEPPLNPPENREQLAEIMFESFSVPSLHIAVQAVCALAASWKTHGFNTTGIVCDSGDGVTHMVPVYQNYVIPSAIKHIPIAGRALTEFVLKIQRSREKIPTHQQLEIARICKEKFAYCSQDIAREFKKFDQDPKKYIKHLKAMDHKTNKEFLVEVGCEAWLAPEIFFNPELANPEFTTPVQHILDHSIQQCPIDIRRSLYKNIVLSGGSTTVRHFGPRLEFEIKKMHKIRQLEKEKIHGFGGHDIEVNVNTHSWQKYAVWAGADFMSNLPSYHASAVSKQDYEEHGSSIVRKNVVFSSVN